MKKVVYKFIFSIVLVLIGLFMWPKKQVKALEIQYPTVILKTQYFQHYYEQENVNTYEYIVEYVVENIVINNLNENEYFFMTEHYIALRKGINRNANTYAIEEIETGSDYTLFNIRVTLNKNFVNSEYSSPNNMFQFFFNDSAFYIQYDVYSLGYSEGFSDGRDYGRGIGYQEGYVNGYDEGYNNGYNIGRENGYNEGYNEGYDEGNWYGYNEGYNTGYNIGQAEGYDNGYNAGQAEGYNNGYESGYNIGYNQGYNAGINEQLADKDFTNLLKSAFIAIGTLLGINLLPGISIGAIIAVPIVFGIIAFILGKRKD